MTDPHLTDALRSMQPDVEASDTEEALRRVAAEARRRRRRGRALTVAAAAAAVVVLAAGVAALDLRDDGERRVVTEAPTSTTAPSTTTPSTSTTSTTTSTTTTVPADPELATFSDLAGGVTGLELYSWMPVDPWWEGLWRADPDLADDVAAIVAAGGDARLPDAFDLVSMRFELPDGRIVVARVDLESGWVGPFIDGEAGLLVVGAQLPDELTRRLRTGFDDAVGRPWEPVDLDHPNSLVGRAIDRMDLPIADLERIPSATSEALDADRVDGYPRWFVEILDGGDGPVLELRERGVGDDSSRGTDYRLRLVQTPTGWDVGGAESRVLCLRSTPGPPPNHGCL
ncbi:hypothetical protein [Actinomarinicola tropica]|uniref:hypothetical protein n=1 Tax=Actinomarinicola tropica TaxID=2789776 RepID=UPI001899B56E|nr:hypothetical protein [Actinomarinicola tropica]